MFKHAFLLTSIIFGITCTIFQPNQHILLPSLEENTSQMLTEGGWDGDFGVTWFPRCEFGGLGGGLVHGWPAKGGYYSHLCTVAELEFLGLDRFKPSDKSDDPEKEEAHCSKMRQLGASWFRNPDHQIRAEASLRNGEPDAQVLFAGWPADGGVWVINATLSQSRRKGLGRIGNAFTMEERCEIIQQLGGTFYADPKDCPHLDLDGSREGSGR